MAFTKKELGEWVKTLGLSEEDQKVVLDKLGADAVVGKVGEGVLAQADYTRRQQELKATEEKLKTEVADRIKAEDAFHGEVASWKQGKEKEFVDAVNARQAAETALASVRDKIKGLATTYTIPEAEVNPLLAGAPNPNPNPNPNPQPRSDDGRFVKPEDLAALQRDAVLVPAILQQIADDHRRLFPNQAIDMVAIVKGAQANNRSLVAEWEQTFKVPERRQEIVTEARNKDISDAEKRGAESERSRLLAENPALGVRARTDAHQGSPILDRARAQAAAAAAAAKDKPAEVDEGRGVSAAIAAFNKGTYQGGVEKPAA